MSDTPEQAYIEEQARQIIYEHPHFSSRAGRFDFKYEERVLKVEGNVPTFHLKQLLQSALRNLNGVERIDNRVSVTTSSC